MKFKIVLISTLCLLAAGCTDEVETEITESEQMKKLTAGEWVRVKYLRNGLDVLTIFPACSKDDLTGYKPDGTAYVDQGADQCDSTYPQRTYWSWEFTDNESKIKETVNDTTFYIREITTLTDQEMHHITYYGEDVYEVHYTRK